MLKYKAGDKATINGVEQVIKVARKDFKNKSIVYVCESNKEFSEAEWDNYSNTEQFSELETVKAQYLIMFGEVPKNKAKNIDWMREKMQEKSFVSPVEEVDQQAENE